MTKTTEQITADLRSAVADVRLASSRASTWMRMRRLMAAVLRENFGYDYFVKVRASREDRAAGRIRVQAVFGGQAINITLMEV